MLGLFGVLNLGTRSLATQRAGVEVAGQNLANVNNPAYARQRLAIETSLSVSSPYGPQGTGADAVAIQQIRNGFVDQQINGELSVGGYLGAQQDALNYAQASLGEVLDLNGEAGDGTGLSTDLNNLFAAFQSVSTSPGSLTERQLLVAKAEDLASHLNQVDQRLSNLNTSLNQSLESDVAGANELLAAIADLNDLIINTENSAGGAANDLRDLRQSKLEELSKLVKVDASESASGGLNISVNGNTLVSDKNVLDTLQTYDAGGGQMLVRTATSGTPLALSGGHIQGVIDVRDGTLATMRDQMDTLAATLISEVNAAHSGGFALNGATGAAFFTGTDAASIQVNSALVNDPSLLQISGTAGNAGDNQVGLILAQLAEKKIPTLNNQTLNQN
ncbi:MAG TPA: flagellar hook-associated protein FlgK, partial [Candidatus Limnocylindria bacterium]|nr:flagellar hook-associated protein FlgK [Candidatus Limnocylindria bacterium]